MPATRPTASPARPDDRDADRSRGGHRRDPADRGADLGQGRRARRPDRGRLRRPADHARVGPQGLAAVHGRPDAGDPLAAPDRPDGGELVRRQLDRVVGAGPHPQGPLGDDRRRGRPDRRGHHRHGPDPELPRPLPPRQEPGLAPDLHAPRQARPPPRRHPGRLRRLHDPGPVRRRLRPRLRGVLPEPPLRRRPEAGGLHEPRMTMHRRPLGGARRLAGLAAIVIIVACLLPWFQTSNDAGLPPLSGNAFSGSGVVVFFVALGVIALLALPYAAGDTPVSVDRPVSFLILTVLGWIALAIRAIDLALTNPEVLFPTRAYGLWLAALGLLLLSRAVYNMTREERV